MFQYLRGPLYKTHTGLDSFGMFYTKILITTEICVMCHHDHITSHSIITALPTLSYICVHHFNHNL